MSMKKALSGIKVRHCKNTAGSPVEVLPVPQQVVLPMSQHMGPPCDVMVAVGDEVKVGQIVGDSTSYVTAPIHASVSGKVVRIEDFVNSMGSVSKAVVIQSDMKQELDPTLEPPVVNGYDQFLQAVRASGLVGLGGAGFPTHVKLKPRNLDMVDTLVVNCAECEPYITSDHHVALEHMDDLFEGIALVKKYLELKKVVIGVENNKPDLIKALRARTTHDDSIEIHSLRSVYPQGAEKVLAYVTTGRIIGEDIYLVGVDALPEAVEAIKIGDMTGTVLNDHIGQSHTAVDVAVKLLNGEEIDNYYWVNYVKVDQAYAQAQ